jgi:hypothetical protein
MTAIERGAQIFEVAAMLEREGTGALNPTRVARHQQKGHVWTFRAAPGGKALACIGLCLRAPEFGHPPPAVPVYELWSCFSEEARPRMLELLRDIHWTLSGIRQTAPIEICTYTATEAGRRMAAILKFKSEGGAPLEKWGLR